MSNTTPSETAPPPSGDRQRQPATDRAYRHVKAGLLDGSHPDGHLLSEGEIAQTLGMSRTPVREAFLRLQSEGFLRLYPKRGALVVPITPAEAHSLLEARLALESFAIDKLAALGEQHLVTVGRRLLDHPACEPGELSDSEMHEADRDFHAQLVAAADSPVVTDLYSALRDRQLRITSTARTHEASRRTAVTEQHNSLATALHHGDTTLAKRRLREHLAHTMRAIGISEDLPRTEQ
ncbi:DNA-binding transcriptional regulator, GntR family [Actinopolyspora lacussalsi subsp. righensis]|uniref:DNA-binding transcriptional regulator, GntR family n=1 Tax=Actinopolyspora righensis TaxID=995060 RepID=A0A1I7C447_9ACTN|nr:GntR family transcriptional regulator [Actinopolyspora righensis]SFT94227.1 DNA-binding transcriptional regulator, GntR family [Actinopolyspora righensis]